MFDIAKKWLVQITEIILLLVALAIVLQVLVGGPVPFFGDVMGDMIAIIAALETSGFIGLVAAGVVVWLLMRKTAAH